MIYTAIALFALAAILGMALLSFVLQGKETNKRVVVTHGPLAVTGLVLLIIYSLRQSPGPIEAIVLFLIAAWGGKIMFDQRFVGKVDTQMARNCSWLICSRGIYLFTFICLCLRDSEGICNPRVFWGLFF